ncbi:MAG TPA: CHASE sensor domain-containing protein, partial [Pseudomonadales bacterium]
MRLVSGMRSFRARLVALIAVTAGVTALSLTLLLLSGENRRLRNESQDTVRSQAEALAIHTAAALRFNDPAAAQETVDAMAPIQHLSAAAVFDRAGTPVARFQRPHENAPTLVPQRLGARTSGHWILFEEPIRQGRDVIGTVIVAYDLSWQRAALWTGIGTALLIAVGAAGIGLLIALPIQRALAEPVAELVRVAHSVTSRREFSFRARKRSDDELGLL